MKTVQVTRETVATLDQAPPTDAPAVVIIESPIRVDSESPLKRQRRLVLTADGIVRPLAYDVDQSLVSHRVAWSPEGDHLAWAVYRSQDPPPAGPSGRPSWYAGVHVRGIADATSRSVPNVQTAPETYLHGLGMASDGVAIAVASGPVRPLGHYAEGAPDVVDLYDHDLVAGRATLSDRILGHGARSSVQLSPDGLFLVAYPFRPDGHGQSPQLVGSLTLYTRQGEELCGVEGASLAATGTPWSADSRRVLFHHDSWEDDYPADRWKVLHVPSGEIELLPHFNGVPMSSERPRNTPVGFADGDRLFVERRSDDDFKLGVWDPAEPKKVEWIVSLTGEAIRGGGTPVNQAFPTRALLAWARGPSTAHSSHQRDRRHSQV